MHFLRALEYVLVMYSKIFLGIAMAGAVSSDPGNILVEKEGSYQCSGTFRGLTRARRPPSSQTPRDGVWVLAVVSVSPELSYQGEIKNRKSPRMAREADPAQPQELECGRVATEIRKMGCAYIKTVRV